MLYVGDMDMQVDIVLFTWWYIKQTLLKKNKRQVFIIHNFQ
jgi:hypothetical protein